MNFKILHLSDLHISSGEDKNHTVLRKKLAQYVGENIKNIDAVVVTGDIVDRYDKDAFPKGEEFVRDVLNAADLSENELVIVPGNHDMERKSAVAKILDEKEMKGADFLRQNGEYIKPRMEAYSRFIGSLEPDWQEDNRYGYGIRVIEKQGRKICFNLLNSAWSNKGNSDYKNLYIGREQLEYNREKLEKIPEKECVVTAMHHPVSWLEEEEADLLKNYLTDEDKIGSGIVLHGHIHDAAMQSEESPAGKILSLISGIGYPKSEEREAGQPKISECRFSVYDLDLERKKADCFSLISVSNGAFVPDNGLYGGSADGHYTMYWGKTEEKARQSGEKYIDLDPIPVTSCWSGREEELELFSRGDTNVIAISGVGGQGKTALAAEFMRRDAEEKERFEQRVWVDCRELQDTMHTKLLTILELLTGGKEKESLYKDEQLKDTIKRFLRYVQRHKVMAVFDNVDAYVTFDTEEFTNELKEVIDGVLTQQNSSLIILTCRTSVYDSRANFRSIRLDGLKEPEGIDYFRKRGISVDTGEDLEACKKMIRITKGHPWWIGLICGQMTAEQAKPAAYLEQNSDGLLTHNSQLEKYFSSIWDKLGESGKGEIKQKIIRFLAESARPLKAEDLSNLLNENFNQTRKAVNHLYRISLLIEHDNGGNNVKSYQIHPLVREYIHKLYSSDAQRPFVLLLLEFIIGKKLYERIFGGGEKNQKTFECDAKDIIDSIETCLTSRNESEALDLMVYSRSALCDNGYLAEFLELSGRILDKIDWKEEQITLLKNRADFLFHYLDVLAMQEHKAERVRYCLALYEKNCDKNTVSYSGYLAARANVMWRLEQYQEAYLAVKDYENMIEKHTDLHRPTDMDNLKGMVLRDSGRVDEALEVFEKNLDSSAKLGNIARCYQKKGEFDQALSKLRECLKELKDTLEDSVNRGYAYFWIAEIYKQQGKFEDSFTFMTVCQEIWKEYAPGLLSRTEGLLRSLEKENIEMRPNSKEEAVRNFLEQP